MFKKKLCILCAISITLTGCAPLKIASKVTKQIIKTQSEKESGESHSLLDFNIPGVDMEDLKENLEHFKDMNPEELKSALKVLQSLGSGDMKDDIDALKDMDPDELKERLDTLQGMDTEELQDLVEMLSGLSSEELDALRQQIQSDLNDGAVAMDEESWGNDETRDNDENRENGMIQENDNDGYKEQESVGDHESFHDEAQDVSEAEDVKQDIVVYNSPEEEMLNNPLFTDYICPFSATKLMTQEDFELVAQYRMEYVPEGKTLQQMIINEMYAVYGYQFQTDLMIEYFEGKSWYNSIEKREQDMNKIYDNMSEVEHKNIDFLRTIN